MRNQNYRRDVRSGSGHADDALIHEVHILYKLLPTTQWIDIAAITLVCGLLVKYIDPGTLTAWFVFAFVIVSARISIQKRYNSASVTTETVHTWLNWFLIGATLYGMMWSVTAILLVPSDIPTVAAFSALILCGLTASGVAVSSVNLKVFTVYTLATLWPYSFFLIASGQSPQSIIGGLVFLFSFVIFVMGFRTYNFFSNMVRLELKSNTLEEELKYEVRKRQCAENALLDNTLEEELADKIRQQSLSLKEGTIQKPAELESLKMDHMSYLSMLNSKINNQLQTIQVIIRDLEDAGLPENQKKQMTIVSKILGSMISTIAKTTVDANQIRQEIDEFDYENHNSRPINIRRMINYRVQGLPLVYKAKHITINRNIDSKVPATMYGNKDALDRILSSLITNAVKFCDGGKVDLTIQNIAEQSGETELRFSIADSGVGMRNNIVDFLQNDRNEEQIEHYPGLAIVKHLVSKHGRNLAVKSMPGVGTEIQFEMKFRMEKPVAA